MISVTVKPQVGKFIKIERFPIHFGVVVYEHEDTGAWYVIKLSDAERLLAESDILTLGKQVK